MKGNGIREKIILQLLKDFHLNTIDRQIFIDNPLKEDEIKDAIKGILSVNSFFPNKFSSWDNCKFNYDGYVIEKLSNEKILVHFQASGAWMNLIENKTSSFQAVNEAVDFYFRHALKGEIDGINIEI